MTIHHGKLHHKTPGWVPSGSRFHIRIRTEGSQLCLTEPDIASRLLSSAIFYHEKNRWYAWLFVVMPDHIHAVISFAQDASMSRVVGDWKKYHENKTGICWQDGFFDHRLRSDDAFMEKAHYIRMNPVRAGLCSAPADWPWLVEPWKQAIK
jgi:REP element-mobilizing transposase RayT